MNSNTRTALMILCAFILGYLFPILTSADEIKEKPAYYIEMYDEYIEIIDPATGYKVYRENYDSESEFINALLQDNE